jgi:PAS domain S-box-containing protein
MNKSTRILVVDDTLAVLQIFSRMLRTRGYEVIQASTGAEGLRLARELRPDLVVLDVVMPDISGTEVCRLIKTDPDLVDVFVILASGEALSVPEKVGGLATGADDYIAKPVIMDEFLARVRTILRLRDTTAALRASEQHYKRLVEVLPDAVLLLNLEGRVVTSNHRASEMVSDEGHVDLTGMKLSDFVQPGDLNRFLAGLAEAKRTGLIRNAEYTRVKKDGSLLHLELSVVLSSDADGHPSGLVAVCRDITERKCSECKIRELSHILNQAHDAISVRDLDGEIQYFNHGAERLFGWTTNEVRGQRPVDLFVRDLPQWEAAQQQLLQFGEWNGELTLRTKSGQDVCVHSRWTVAQSNQDQSPHILAIYTDITERKRAQQRLADAQKLSQTILDNILDPAWLKDTPADAFWRLTNPWLGSTANSPMKWLAKPSADLAPQEAEWLARGDEEVVQSGRTSAWLTNWCDESQRGALWFEIAKSPVFNEGGQVVGTVGIARDISERKWAEYLLQAQRDFGVFLSSTNDLTASMQRLLAISIELEGIDCGAVLMADPGTDDLKLTVHHGFSKSFNDPNARRDPGRIGFRGS